MTNNFKYFKGKSKEEIRKSLNGKHLKTKFILAVKKDIPFIVQECLNKGFDPSPYNEFIIKHIFLYNLTNIFNLLYNDIRLDFSIDNNYAIRRSSFVGNIEVVKLLLKRPEVNPTDEDNDAFYSAKMFKQYKLMKLLLQHPKVKGYIFNHK